MATVKLGPGIRNICEKLINEFNSSIITISAMKREPNDKIKEFKNYIKPNFWPFTKNMPKILKNFDKLDKDIQTIQTLNGFYESFNRIINLLDFQNKLSEIYTFPEFNLGDTTDLIFSGCTNDLKQELIKSNLLNVIASKNLYDNNDVSFLLNNDLNNEDYNNEQNINKNILLDENNPITKKIKERITRKLDDFNNYIFSNKEGFNEDNFKLFLNEYICAKIYDNFIIKFILVQKKTNNNIYFLLPIELEYNNEIINLNDKDELFQDKNKFFSKKDLQYFIDKFKPKQIFNRNININTELEIQKFSKEDFIEKCLLFKEYTKSLFNDKFENLKKKIINFIDKYDMPIFVEDSVNNIMDIDNKEDNNNDINEFTIYYNFAINMKKKNEFYIKLIYDKNYPTIINMIFSHNRLIFKKENNQNNLYFIYNIYTEQVEKKILFNLKEIKTEIKRCYEDYKYILTLWIYKKIVYIYPIYFDFGFQIHELSIILGIKSSRDHNLFSRKLFSFYINDLGKLSFSDLFSSKIFYDDFKELNTYIINYLKNIDDEDEQNEYIIKFNNYINKIILEKILIFPGVKTKLIELNNETKKMSLYIYNSNYTDKNISTYFMINCDVFKSKKDLEIANSISCFKINEIKLICQNNKDNKKIILNCLDNTIKQFSKKIEYNSHFTNYMGKIVCDLNNKYELFMLYACDIIKLSEKEESPFQLKTDVEIINNFDNKEECYEILLEKKIIDIFKPNYKESLIKYFNKIKFSKENNVFQFYLKPEIFKEKYRNNLKFVIENYSIMFQYYIFGYDYKEDFISIIVLSKLKLGYINIMQIVFESFVTRIMSYMNSIFKLIDNLFKNSPVPSMIGCPLFLTLQIYYKDIIRNINFKKHINFKIIEKDPFYIADGNFNNIFGQFIKDFGTEIMSYNFDDFKNEKYFWNKSKYFYLGYSIYDLLLNDFCFKIALISYPYNHFKPNSPNVYFITKDFNVLELIAINKIIMTIQIRSDNSLYLEFRDNSNLDINGNNENGNKMYMKTFSTEMNKVEFTNQTISRNNKLIILIDDFNENEKISLIEKLKEIINIFVILSNN